MNQQDYNGYSKAVKNYKTTRMNVVLFMAFTLINIFALMGGTYFLFSIYGSVICFSLGFSLKQEAAEAGAAAPNAYLAVGIVAGILILAAFFVFWMLSKKRAWAMTVLFVLFSLDTLIVLIALFLFQDYTMMIDLVVHGVIVWVFFGGVKAAKKLRDFPEGVSLNQQRLDELYRAETGVDPVTGAPVAAASEAFASYGSAAGENVGGEVPEEVSCAGEAEAASAEQSPVEASERTDEAEQRSGAEE